MSKLHCPHCAQQLAVVAEDELACASCQRPFRRQSGVWNLLLKPDRAGTPWPLADSDVAAAWSEHLEGARFKAVLEHLLLRLELEPAELLMQLLRESRGAWIGLSLIDSGRALFLGNALSGAVVPIANAGLDVTVLEPNAARLQLSRCRNEALCERPVQTVAAGDARHLPFADGSFDLVVREETLPEGDGLGYSFDECHRVCSGELVLTADNRFGYKRSIGRRGEFHKPSLVEFALRFLRPERGERSLPGYRKLLRNAGFAAPRSYALYPHAREFAHVVSLDARTPRLTIGPKERSNRLKWLGFRAGLFPWLTPSFAFVAPQAQRAFQSGPRIEAILDELAERLDEPRPEVDQYLATRGNTTLVHTHVPAADESDPRGRWTLHVPLSPQQRQLLEQHHARTTELRRDFPGVPVPEPLLLGSVQGLFLGCERRLPGVTAPHLDSDPRTKENLYFDAALQTSGLVMEQPRTFDEDDFTRLVSQRIELVARYCAVESTRKNLVALERDVRPLLVGAAVPRVMYHADLRSKHVQAHPDGHVIGYLDWSSSEERDLPYFDLLHLIVHDRKQDTGCSAQEAWNAVCSPNRGSHEARALNEYAQRLSLSREVRTAIERLYPVLVGGMAEKNWDYSRPRWVHRQFGL